MDYRSAVQTSPSQSNSGQQQGHDDLKPFDDLVEYLRVYTREKPEVVALTCFGIGFILGWKLKPW